MFVGLFVFTMVGRRLGCMVGRRDWLGERGASDVLSMLGEEEGREKKGCDVGWFVGLIEGKRERAMVGEGDDDVMITSRGKIVTYALLCCCQES